MLSMEEASRFAGGYNDPARLVMSFAGVSGEADGSGLSAEEPGDKIEAEQADAAPVDPADDGQDQSDTVHDHKALLLSYDIALIVSERKAKYSFDKTGAASLFTNRARGRMLSLSKSSYLDPHPCFGRAGLPARPFLSA